MASDATPTAIEWYPAKLLQSRETAPAFALVVLNQPLRNGANLRRLWRNCTRKFHTCS
jgi:thiamine pyrophosphokinase